MINPMELKLGNYAALQRADKTGIDLFQITSIIADDNAGSFRIYGTGYTHIGKEYDTDFRLLIAARLNDETFKKMGFIIDGIEIFPINKPNIKIKKQSDSASYAMFNKEGVCIKANIVYLHNFQNLWSEITGEYLELANDQIVKK